MGFAFNPFTGNFDVKGAGGGGGSAFFAGEVATYADLPLDGTAALDSRWLVRSNSGTWPFSSYKQAGVYVRIATVGSSRDNDYRLTDTSFFDVMSDSAFLLYDDGDATKNLKFQLSGIDTATTRTLTVPNASGRIQVEGQPIGNTTPAAGSFTTLSATPASGSALTLTGGTVTASAPLIDASQTWNNAAVTFTGLRVNVTNTASAAASLLADVQVGGTNVFSINRAGGLGAGGTSWLTFTTTFGSAAQMGGVWLFGGLAFNVQSSLGVNSGVIQLGSNMSIGWSSNTSPTAANADLRLFRDAADTLAQYRGTNAQTFRIYNTFTDASNYERLFIRGQTGANFQIGTEALGTGSGRNLELVRAGTTQFRVDSNGVTVRAAIGGSFAGYQFGSSGVTGVDCSLFRDEVAVLGTENSFRFYNTAAGGRPWTSTTITSFERATISWASNVFRIAAEKGTTGGSARAIEFATDSTTRLTIGASGGFTLADAQDVAVGTTTGTKIGTATTQKIGFFNATPVVQQSSTGTAATGFTANGPTNTVHADSTFTGNVGATAYTISDIVKHLKTIGLIAS